MSRIEEGTKRVSKTIGIVTLQDRSNYGNRLQNYATSRIYESCGYKPYSLMLDKKPPFSQKAMLTLGRLLGQVKPSREESMSMDRLASFDRFNELMEFRTLHDVTPEDICDIDYFSAGSDWIWYIGRAPLDEDWRFLQFVEPARRIALAPSFGTERPLTNAQTKRLARYMKGYPRISIREEWGAQLIKRVSGRDAVVICDPTMALPVSQWRSISSNRLTPKGDYVFAYMLGSASTEADRALEVASKQGELPIVSLSSDEKTGEIPAGPAEFISLIDNASWVVTDSFHGSIFASLFQRPLTIVRRCGGSNMFGRLETLSKKLGIEHKVYGSPDFDFSRAGEYEGVSEAIERERNRFMEYLGSCLNA